MSIHKDDIGTNDFNLESVENIIKEDQDQSEGKSDTEIIGLPCLYTLFEDNDLNKPLKAQNDQSLVDEEKLSELLDDGEPEKSKNVVVTRTVHKEKIKKSTLVLLDNSPEDGLDLVDKTSEIPETTISENHSQKVESSNYTQKINQDNGIVEETKTRITHKSKINESLFGFIQSSKKKSSRSKRRRKRSDLLMSKPLIRKNEESESPSEDQAFTKTTPIQNEEISFHEQVEEQIEPRYVLNSNNIQSQEQSVEFKSTPNFDDTSVFATEIIDLVKDNNESKNTSEYAQFLQEDDHSLKLESTSLFTADEIFEAIKSSNPINYSSELPESESRQTVSSEEKITSPSIEEKESLKSEESILEKAKKKIPLLSDLIKPRRTRKSKNTVSEQLETTESLEKTISDETQADELVIDSLQSSYKIIPEVGLDETESQKEIESGLSEEEYREFVEREFSKSKDTQPLETTKITEPDYSAFQTRTTIQPSYQTQNDNYSRLYELTQPIEKSELSNKIESYIGESEELVISEVNDVLEAEEETNEAFIEEKDQQENKRNIQQILGDIRKWSLFDKNSQVESPDDIAAQVSQSEYLEQTDYKKNATQELNSNEIEELIAQEEVPVQRNEPEIIIEDNETVITNSEEADSVEPYPYDSFEADTFEVTQPVEVSTTDEEATVVFDKSQIIQETQKEPEAAKGDDRLSTLIAPDQSANKRRKMKRKRQQQRHTSITKTQEVIETIRVENQVTDSFIYSSVPENILNAGLTLYSNLTRQMQNNGTVRVEYLMTVLGSLAGYSTQAAAREKMINRLKLEEDQVFSVIETADGSRYFFGDAIDRTLQKDAHSIWYMSATAAMKLTGKVNCNINEVVRYTIRNLGKKTFGVPRIPKNLRTGNLPEYYVKHLWIPIQAGLERFTNDPLDWPTIFGVALQKAMINTKDILDPNLSLRIILESAVPTSVMEIIPINPNELVAKKDQKGVIEKLREEINIIRNTLGIQNLPQEQRVILLQELSEKTEQLYQLLY